MDPKTKTQVFKIPLFATWKDPNSVVLLSFIIKFPLEPEVLLVFVPEASQAMI